MTDDAGRPVRVAVVGGGISGLSAAWFLRQALGSAARITVYDKNRQIGGHLRVSEVAGVPVDEGAESLLARRPEAVDLARAVGLADDMVTPAAVGAEVWSRGRLESLPAAMVMGVPERVEAARGVLNAADAAEGDDTAPGMPIDSDIAIGQLVRSRFGSGVVDRLVDPLLGGVYAGRADELSLDATVPALGEQARRHSSLSAAVAAVRAGMPATGRPAFAGVRGGVGRLPDAVTVAAAVDVHTGVTVRELHRTDTGWRLVAGPVPEPVTDEADAVVVATPAVAAARLLRAECPTAAHELSGVEAASMAIVTLAMPASAFATAPATSGFLVPAVDGRLIKAVTYSSVKWPWLGERSDDVVVLRASIGRYRQVEELQRDDDELVAGVVADLHDAIGLSGVPVDARVTRWGGALPQYAVGHLDRVARIRDAVSRVPGLAVCGALYDGVGVAACVASARAAAARAAGEIAEQRARIGA